MLWILGSICPTCMLISTTTKTYAKTNYHLPDKFKFNQFFNFNLLNSIMSYGSSLYEDFQSPKSPNSQILRIFLLSFKSYLWTSAPELRKLRKSSNIAAVYCHQQTTYNKQVKEQYTLTDLGKFEQFGSIVWKFYHLLWDLGKFWCFFKKIFLKF
jgi:hypothetical protein